jgi:anthranilate phosphoribosyltransferase
VLEALGVNIQLTAEQMGDVLGEVGIVFMFAPLLHPAMRHVGPVRRELKISTVMNLLGPLTNPAGARRQVVGVADPDLLPLVVEAFQQLGHERALVVHGEPGLDEVSPLGPTRIALLDADGVREEVVTPEELGVPTSGTEGLGGGSPEENAVVIRAVLNGEMGGSARAAVVLNAAAAFFVSGRVDDLQGGVEEANKAIDSGSATETLDQLREATQAAATP